MFNQHQKEKWINYFEFALYLLAAFCFVYFLMQGKYPKVFEAALIVAVLFLFRILVKFTEIEIFPALRFSILLFIFVTMFIANEFGFYGIIPNLDKVEHLFSGVILSLVGLLIFKKVDKNGESIQVHYPTAVLFSLFFAVAIAGCWEIYEFTTDYIFGLDSQKGSLVDTMEDIICGTIGAIATSLYLIYKARKKELPINQS